MAKYISAGVLGSKPIDENYRKKVLLFSSLKREQVLVAFHAIWNMGNIYPIIKKSNNFIKKNNTKSPTFPLIPPAEQEIYLKYYRTMIAAIYHNFTYQADGEDEYSIQYIPLLPEEYRELSQQVPLKDFEIHFNYLESSIIEFLMLNFDTKESTLMQDDRVLSFDLKHIRELKQYVRQAKIILGQDYLWGLTPEWVNLKLDESQYRSLNQDKKILLFGLSFSSMNSALLNRLLHYQNKQIYYDLQAVNPLIYLDFSLQQDFCIMFYTFMANRSQNLNMLRQQEWVAPSSLIVDYFHKLRYYKNLIKIFEIGFGKVDNRHFSSEIDLSQLLSKLNLQDRFKKLLYLSTVQLHSGISS